MALRGIRVLEVAGLAPVPFCGMLLADFGADVIRVDKNPPGPNTDILSNGKQSIALNLKTKEGVNIFKAFSRKVDVLIEPFRPGVMEKLGLGPDVLLRENARLIYARLSGYGQTGKMARRAGHDLNYISYSGTLSLAVSEGKIPPPYFGDFAGGGLMCAFGILAALVERSKSGKGQIVDASITAGSAYAASWLFRANVLPFFDGPNGQNLLDGGSHFYNVYKTKDDRWLSVGCLEPQFYEDFVSAIGLNSDEFPQYPDNQAEAIETVSHIIKQHTLDHWIKVFKDREACVEPVHTVEEAVAANPDGYVQRLDKTGWAPVPSPVLSRTPATSLCEKYLPLEAGTDSIKLLKELGYSDQEIKVLSETGVVLDKNKL